MKETKASGHRIRFLASRFLKTFLAIMGLGQQMSTFYIPKKEVIT